MLFTFHSAGPKSLYTVITMYADLYFGLYRTPLAEWAASNSPTMMWAVYDTEIIAWFFSCFHSLHPTPPQLNHQGIHNNHSNVACKLNSLSIKINLYWTDSINITLFRRAPLATMGLKCVIGPVDNFVVETEAVLRIKIDRCVYIYSEAYDIDVLGVLNAITTPDSTMATHQCPNPVPLSSPQQRRQPTAP